SERADVEPRHDPGVLASRDDELVPKRRPRRGEVIHVSIGAEDGEGDEREPDEPRVLKVETGSALWLTKVEIDPGRADEERDEELNRAHADVSAGGVQPERETLLPI